MKTVVQMNRNGRTFIQNKPLDMMRTLLSFSIILVFISCSSTGKTGSDLGYVEDQNTMTLVDHIHSLAGIVVNGDGANATIRVRGSNSLSSQNAPLFILDGIDMGHDFSSVYYSVSANNIKRVKLLKEPSQTGIYGVRGANGVIIIRTKGTDPRFVN